MEMKVRIKMKKSPRALFSPHTMHLYRISYNCHKNMLRLSTSFINTINSPPPPLLLIVRHGSRLMANGLNLITGNESIGSFRVVRYGGCRRRQKKKKKGGPEQARHFGWVG